MATGITGAIIMALNIPISGYGFLFYIYSSCAWLSAALLMKERTLIIQSIVYTILNAIGIYRWLF